MQVGRLFFLTKDVLGDTTFGSGTYDEAYRIKIIEVDGVKIGFLAVCYVAKQGVFSDVTKHEGYGCAYINDMRVNHVIHEAKQQVDYLFVLPHDGIEYIDAPMPEIIARYRDFIDWGADGVMASHPHSPQGWENYKGKPIFYSLANFFFNSTKDTSWVAKEPHWYEGRCVKLTIEGTDLSWEVINTRNVRNEALVIDNSEESKLHNELIRGYLQDKEAYNAYMMPVQEDQFRKDMRLIQKTFKPKTVREAIRVLKECVKMRLHGQKPMTGGKMMYMLKNDLKRYRIVRMLASQK